jgi:CheY-like chemotaxis protein/HPt (histidine-containing phosphotransfer) domain-containing protein
MLNADPQADTANPYASYEASMRQEFIDYAGDRLTAMDETLESFREGGQGQMEVIVNLRQVAHNLKGTGGTFGFPLITTISHRLENYLSDLKELDERNRREIQIYVDVMTDLVSSGRDLADFEVQATIRDLPPKPGFDVGDVEISEIEVMLAMPGDTAAHFVTRQLQACGYRVVTVTSPFEALEQAVRTRPDLLIASALMDGLSGIELTSALRGIESTKSLPVALLTSLSKEDHHLQALPPEVPVIRKGAQFGDDLADALQALGVT